MTQFATEPQPATLFRRKFFRFAPNLSVTLALLVFLVISILAFRLFAAPVVAEKLGPDAPGSITGVVKTPDGAPQANIEVFLFQPNTSSASDWRIWRSIVTQADGQYRFSLLPPGVYRVGLKDQQKNFASIYYPTAPTLERALDLVVTGNQLTGIDFVLQPGGQITGVISATDRVTVTSADVALYHAVERRGVLSWEPFDPLFIQPAIGGVYRFTGLSPNLYRVCAYGRSPNLTIYECYDNVYELVHATSLTLTAGAAISNVDIVLGDGANFAQLNGRVTNANQEPLAAIQVAVVTMLPEGPPVVRATSPVFLSQSAMRLNGANSPADEFYGNFWARTDAQGNYHLTTIPAGRYYLYFSDPTGNYVAEYYNNVLYRDGASVIELASKQVISDVNAQLQTANRIRGVVTLFGQAAAGGEVSAERQTATGWRHAMTGYVNPITGQYELGGLPDGAYSLQAFAFINSGPTASYYYTNTTTEISLAGGQTKLMDLVLAGQTQFNGSISGRVTAEGVALSGAKVALYPEDFTCCSSPNSLLTFQPMIYVFTNQDGQYTINGLSTRKVFLSATDTNGVHATIYYANQVFPVASNAIMAVDGKALTGIDLDLPIAGAIRGRVTRRNGEPVAGLIVSTYLPVATGLSLQELVSADTYTDADGRYTVNRLHPGEYYVCFTAGDYTECYGSPDRVIPRYFNNPRARVTVVTGEISKNVDLLWGPDLANYLPIIAR